MILWFTDGQLDVPGSGEAEAWGQLCEPQGMVEGIRRAGTAIVAAALVAEDTPQTAVWRDELRAVAEGYGTSTTCGATPLAAGLSAGCLPPRRRPERSSPPLRGRRLAAARRRRGSVDHLPG